MNRTYSMVLPYFIIKPSKFDTTNSDHSNPETTPFRLLMPNDGDEKCYGKEFAILIAKIGSDHFLCFQNFKNVYFPAILTTQI